MSVVPRILLAAVCLGTVVSLVAWTVDLPTWGAFHAVILTMALAVWIVLHRRVSEPLQRTQAWIDAWV